MDALTRTLERMRGRRAYIDSNFFIYFLTRHPSGFAAAAAVLQACDAGTIIGTTGDAVVAELLVKPHRDDDTATIHGIRQLFSREHFIQRLPHDAECFELAAELRGKQGGKLMDALHFATAVRGSCRFFLSNDHTFKSTERMTVLQLQDFAE